MTANQLKQGSGKELKRLFALLCGSLGETLGSLVNKQIVVRPAEPEVQTVEEFLAALQRPCAAARGALDKAFAGKTVATLIEVGDAVAMAGMLMMTPEDVIATRRAKGTIEGEDAEAFGELGNVLYSGLGNVLRDQVGNIDVRYQDHALVRPGADADSVLGRSTLYVFPFHMKVGEYPESTGALTIDVAIAEAWNKGPLEFAAPDAATKEKDKDAAAAAAVRDDDGLEGIPAAPIRGTLAAFVLQSNAFRMLRRSCRRVGLELRRHGRAEVPNPAAHKNEIVLMDVPPGEDRRFDWCRRVKELSESTKVVLLIHHPSRQRVTQAFLSKADAILGFPCDEMQLSQKLGSLLPNGGEPPAAT
jgi:CheY-like chemotaxis protein/chemotaxis protein CheY-P-specific phosphatase CheC